MSRFPRPQVSLRDANKLANTNMTNELAAAMLAAQPGFVTGESRPPATYDFSFWASVATVGPNGEANYTDARYWVKPLYLPPVAVASNVTYVAAGDTMLGATTVTATNLGEREFGNISTGNETHLILPGELVRVSVWADGGGPADSSNPDGVPARPHYVFEKRPPIVLPVTLVVDGGGDGSAGAVPTYTYTMIYRAVTLGTAQSPKHWRQVGHHIAANFGYAHLDPNAAGSKLYQLGLTNETPAAQPCSTS
jgi:hypothetical protein